MFSAVPRASIGPFGPGTAAKSVAGQVAERVGGEDWIQGRDVGKLWQRFSGWWFNRDINGDLMVINPLVMEY